MSLRRRAHAFIYREGKVLVLRQASGAQWWGQPGGDVESGEDPAAAVVREVLEETGLRVETPVLLRTWSYADRRGDVVRCYSYAAMAPNGEVVLSEEHTEHAWMTAGEYAERYCGEPVAAPDWARAFFAGMRENCALFSAWLSGRSDP
jgi:acetyl-CoA carboxylase carboxyl transferase subunit beta